MSSKFCMLAQPYDPARVKCWPVSVEPKIDGMRALCVVGPQRATFYSRNAKSIPALQWLADLIFENVDRHSGVELMTLDGEVTSGSFKKTMQTVRRKSEPALDAVFHVFDLLGGYAGLHSADPYYERRALLDKNLRRFDKRIKIVKRRMATSHAMVQRWDTEFRAQGYEGTIVKQLGAVYECRRSYAWMKIKASETVDGRVVEVTPGEGKHTGRAGALIVKVGRGVTVHVGTGFTDAQRVQLWRHRKSVLGRWVEVECHQRTERGSLRHPRFIRFRDSQTGMKE